MKIDSNKLYKIYLALVSFISIIAVAITLGIVLTSFWKYLLITDDEYIQFKEKWRIDNCNFYWNPDGSRYQLEKPIEQDLEKKPTKEEIDLCVEQITKDVSLRRSFELKEMFISSWAWFIVFLILFILHYPKFLKSRNS